MVLLEVVAAGYLLNEHRKKKRAEYRAEAEEDLRRRGLRTPEERLAEEQQRSLDGDQSHLLPPNSPYPPRSNSVPPPGYMPAGWSHDPYSASYQQPPYQPMQPALSAQPVYPPSQNPPPLQPHHSYGPSQYGAKTSHAVAGPHAQYSDRDAPGNMNTEEPWKNHPHLSQPPHESRTLQDRRGRSKRRARTPPPTYRPYA
ncbi:hypothetical protein AOQ84DRAFT_357728 [Glonium stellatum]|uniref:Uncharacterized protein n=1 Tax=Glonium stellatum TaxID=574774 RepID=A0A8E2ENK7_9PEZI|nr:hypothetical protein AOQ84DRAFT_357728 [Glonium stellatum]